MRTRKTITEIINKITPTVTQGENLMLEVLLDIRDLLANPIVEITHKDIDLPTNYPGV